MGFVYVDRICSFTENKQITGFKNVSRNEGFFYWLPTGERVLSPAVISESLAQLGAWLSIASHKFKKRPVLLADELTQYFKPVSAGSQLRLNVEVIDTDEDVVVTKGKAFVGDTLVCESKCTRGYMLPSGDFQDPEQLQRSFNQLLENPVFEMTPKPLHCLKPLAGSYAFESLRMIDSIIEHSPYKSIESLKYVSNAENYFSDHFPRRPVVPGVILLSFVGETAQYLIKEQLDGPLRAKALIPRYISNVRFRKFVSPGDVCHIKLKLIEGNPQVDATMIKLAAQIFVGTNRVMQAEMGFLVMNGHDSKAKELLS